MPEQMDNARVEAQKDVRDVRSRITRLDDDGIDLVLRRARTHYSWADMPVTDDDLRQIYDIMIMGPTSNNGCPIRLFFTRSQESKERMIPALHGNNVEKAVTAPACAILAYDMEFYEKLPVLFPHRPTKKQMFIENKQRADDDAFRNGTLQGAYFIIAARALGFDVGPISGFDNEMIDKEFFAGTTLRSNFICGIGHGKEADVWQKLPRPPFEELCEII
ncbi:MAG: malonic semialdehyde reductase [Rhodospirillaceae bacterium]|jgi:3-hydroxypropanoate dehydrogenase|nr:malonic semialdehyde reductase [Rhodospirillales bacterium]MBT3904188.1 malonic semialdehyde reductase [Rhodospirillaceae bacterium]MBT4701920.1 malonic semialdehyde reductase [Rhodospirillaceae bacterium]MBT5035412.1 malonic semialdehyde reductase [Rhodospirillaceae bacterium]MBT6220986.1 malonic semialdehyde reductase [Rhodospirillaceae bacterium]